MRAGAEGAGLAQYCIFLCGEPGEVKRDSGCLARS